MILSPHQPKKVKPGKAPEAQAVTLKLSFQPIALLNIHFKRIKRKEENTKKNRVSLTLLHHLFLLWMVGVMPRNDAGLFQVLSGKKKKKKKEAQVTVFIPG